jgi:carbonic anhydrase
VGGPRVSVSGSFAGSLALPDLPHDHWFGVIAGVLTVTLVASVESMLSAVAVDQLRPGRSSDLDRELRGQGIANAVSGLVGGLPITGVIVRSTTNAQSGARTRASAVIHGIWVILFGVLLSGWLERIPLAVLAGLLLAVGVRLVNLAHIKAIHRHGDLPIYAVTLAGVVGIGVLEGVLIGIALTLVLVVHRVVWAQVSAVDTPSGWRVIVEGRLSFLTIPRLSRALGQVPPGAPVTLELVLDYLDHAAYEHVMLWRERHVASGGTVTLDEIGTVALAPPDSGPVRRDRRFHYVLPRWFSPWSYWQQSSAGGLERGLSEYQRRGADLVRPFYSELVDQHAPTVMFLTCADARVMPNLITMSGPGDLFTVRNLGNLIPRYGEDPDSSVISALQYAIDVLNVSDLVICGHSGCGAMTALLSEPDDRLEWLQKWLAAAEPTMQRWRSGSKFADTGYGEVNRMVLTNLEQQLENARTIPFVDRAIQSGRLRVTAAFFDIGTASLSTYDEKAGTFNPQAEPVAPTRTGDGDDDADSGRRGTRKDRVTARGSARRPRG